MNARTFGLVIVCAAAGFAPRAAAATMAYMPSCPGSCNLKWQPPSDANFDGGIRITRELTVPRSESLAVADASCSSSSLVIDDYSSGQYRVTLRPAGRLVMAVRRGSMIGGSRLTIFSSAANRFNQRATLDIGPGDSSALVIDTGIHVSHRLEMYYGFDLRRGQVIPTPLNLDLSCFSKFRVHFNANDQGINVTMQVTAGNNPGNRAQHALNIPGHTDGAPFVVDFPFSDFEPNAGPLPNFTDIDLIDIISQTGSAIGANDYAITLIEAVR
jgi:hypothetical protein